MAKEIGGDRKNAFPVHGDEPVCSDTLMVADAGAESFPLFTRQILTLATLNLHYGGVH